MPIHESGENYLETILILKEEKGAVRSVDIVEKLGYAKSSVSRAVNNLKKIGYISVSKDGRIDFTKKGIERAQSIYNRHKIITDFLMAIGVSEENAEKDACKLEHDLSSESIMAMKSFAEKHKV
ncbi:MAG: metal-dependent transcriptional regulator [Clostridiales bacterium]|nr:metal-dependent transcriptional regulator [Clostridiales bacterium]